MSAPLTTGEITAIVGLIALILNAGIQWGLQLAARAQNERDHERLEKMIVQCRSDSKSEAQGSTREIEALSVKIESGFEKLGTKFEAFADRVHAVEIAVERTTMGSNTGRRGG